MKIHDLDPEIVLKVSIDCFDNFSCSRKLEKYLMEFSGVYTVVIDPENCLITGRGKVDPVVVLNAVRETGHFAELFSYQKEPKVEDEDNEKWYEYSYQKHHRDDHEIEDYLPPPEEIDPEICRDFFFCRHRRRRPNFITNGVTVTLTPPWERADHPRHHHYDSYHENPFDYLRRPGVPPPPCGWDLGRPMHEFSSTYANRTCTIM